MPCPTNGWLSIKNKKMVKHSEFILKQYSTLKNITKAKNSVNNKITQVMDCRQDRLSLEPKCIAATFLNGKISDLLINLIVV